MSSFLTSHVYIWLSRNKGIINFYVSFLWWCHQLNFFSPNWEECMNIKVGEMKNDLNVHECKKVLLQLKKFLFSYNKRNMEGKRSEKEKVNKYLYEQQCFWFQSIKHKVWMYSEGKWYNTKITITLWFYDAFITINVLNSP